MFEICKYLKNYVSDSPDFVLERMRFGIYKTTYLISKSSTIVCMILYYLISTIGDLVVEADGISIGLRFRVSC